MPGRRRWSPGGCWELGAPSPYWSESLPSHHISLPLLKSSCNVIDLLWNLSWVPSVSPISSDQFSSVAQLCPTLCDPMHCSMPGLPVHHQLRSSPKLMSIELVMPSSHLILCRRLLLPPSIFPIIRVFSNESTLHMRWPKY